MVMPSVALRGRTIVQDQSWCTWFIIAGDTESLLLTLLDLVKLSGSRRVHFGLGSGSASAFGSLAQDPCNE